MSGASASKIARSLNAQSTELRGGAMPFYRPSAQPDCLFGRNSIVDCETSLLYNWAPHCRIGLNQLRELFRGRVRGLESQFVQALLQRPRLYGAMDRIGEFASDLCGRLWW